MCFPGGILNLETTTATKSVFIHHDWLFSKIYPLLCPPSYGPMCSEAIAWKEAKYVESEGAKRFFTELGCEDCWYNKGTVEQSVCDHPLGPRFIFNVRCANYVKGNWVMGSGNKKKSS
jgi:hypothetical protein